MNERTNKKCVKPKTAKIDREPSIDNLIIIAHTCYSTFGDLTSKRIKFNECGS